MTGKDIQHLVILLLLCPVLLLLPGCLSCNKTQLTVCDTMSLQVLGVGSMPSMVVISVYKADNAFDMLVTTDTVTPTTMSGDTAVLTKMVDLGHGNDSVVVADIIKAGFIVPGYDYKLRILPPDTTFELTNIATTGNIKQEVTYRTGFGQRPPECLNAILSCKVNDSAMMVNSTDTTQGSLYLKIP